MTKTALEDADELTQARGEFPLMEKIYFRSLVNLWTANSRGNGTPGKYNGSSLC